jgi:glycosyltransferase involved in cell wall biosynthesis
MTPPLFSVILPTHNRATLLPRAIDSVLNQELQDFELIVVDDGSTDGTAGVIARLPDDRLAFVRQDHSGVSAARNAGALRASGAYLAFLDSDDEALPNWLARLGDIVERSGAPLISCGALYSRDDRERPRVVLPRRMGTEFAACNGLFLAGTFAVLRPLFLEAGGYEKTLAFAENTELALRLIAMCHERGWKIEHVDEALVRVHERQRKASHHLAMFESAKFLLATHREHLDRNPKALSDYAAVAGVGAARFTDRAEALRWFAMAIRARPRRIKNYLRWLVARSQSLTNRVWSEGARPSG